MTTGIIAVPSTQPGGVDANVDRHFGHCGIYTIAKVENGKITSVTTLESIPHAQGGCLAPVEHLASHGVTTLLAGGMGMRPLVGFQQAGVTVCFAGNCATVGEALSAFTEGKLQPFSTQNTCTGGCSGHE